ncbi:MAG: hypothetical protein Q9216_004801 [Gyalolechia sp. 2 TL-2023]
MSALSTDDPTSDAAYNRDTDLWACCYGLGTLDSGHTDDQTFQTPPSENLRTIVSSTASTSSSPSSTSSIPESTTAASTTSLVPVPGPTGTDGNNDLDLSSGAKAGIGIGAAIAGLALIRITLLEGQWLRRRRTSGGIKKEAIEDLPRIITRLNPQELDARQQAELDSRARSELDSRA